MKPAEIIEARPRSTQAWERMAGEPSTAWVAFQAYRDQGPMRTIDAVATPRSPATVKAWSAAFRWRERAAAWDVETDRRRQEANRAAIAKMGEDHAKIAASYIAVLTAPARELSSRIQRDPNWLHGLTAKELITVAARAADAIGKLVTVERLSRGVSTENIAVGVTTSHGTVMPGEDPLDALADDPDGLAALLAVEARLVAKAGRPALGPGQSGRPGADHEPREDRSEQAASPTPEPPAG
jgi:hypothetical protein